MPANDRISDAKVQVGVVLELLDQTDGVVVQDVYDAIKDVDDNAIANAVTSLVVTKVLRTHKGRLYPTSALLRLDAIGMICI